MVKLPDFSGISYRVGAVTCLDIDRPGPFLCKWCRVHKLALRRYCRTHQGQRQWTSTKCTSSRTFVHHLPRAAISIVGQPWKASEIALLSLKGTKLEISVFFVLLHHLIRPWTLEHYPHRRSAFLRCMYAFDGLRCKVDDHQAIVVTTVRTTTVQPRPQKNVLWVIMSSALRDGQYIAAMLSRAGSYLWFRPC